jgi:hypothetical protein
VVVGGTSLMGGQGKIFGTLIGAFIIAVINNGMNLIDVDPFNQKIVLGAVLILAVLLDSLKRRGNRQLHTASGTSYPASSFGKASASFCHSSRPRSTMMRNAGTRIGRTTKVSTSPAKTSAHASSHNT